jgi:hypothetical protein
VIISVKNINQLIVVMETHGIFFEVGIEVLNIEMSFGHQRATGLHLNTPRITVLNDSLMWFTEI